MSEQDTSQESGGNLQGILIGVAAVLAVIIVVLFVLFQNAQGDLTETRDNATLVAVEAATSAARADAAQLQATQAAITAVAALDAETTAAALQATAESEREQAESAQATAESERGQAESAQATAESEREQAEETRAAAQTAQATAERAQATADAQARAAATTAAQRQSTADAFAADLDAANATATMDAEALRTERAAAADVEASATAAVESAATNEALATISVATSRPAFATAQARLDTLATSATHVAGTATRAADFVATQGAQATAIAATATAAAGDARATLEAERDGFSATLTAIAPQPAITDEPGGPGPNLDEPGEQQPGAVPTPAPDSQIIIIEVLGRGDVNAETVVIQNNGNTLDLNGWTLADTEGNAYTFDEVRIFSDGQILVFTRSGEDTPIGYYWNRSEAVFGEAGDAVILRDADGVVQAVLALDGANASGTPPNDKDDGRILTVADGPTLNASLPGGAYVFEYLESWWGAVELANAEPPSTAVLNNEGAFETAGQGDGNPRPGETWVFVLVIDGGPDATAESVLREYIAANLEAFDLTPITLAQVTGYDDAIRDLAYASIQDGDGRFIIVDLGGGTFGLLDAFGQPDEFDGLMPEYMVIASTLRPGE